MLSIFSRNIVRSVTYHQCAFFHSTNLLLKDKSFGGRSITTPKATKSKSEPVKEKKEKTDEDKAKQKKLKEEREKKKMETRQAQLARSKERKGIEEVKKESKLDKLLNMGGSKIVELQYTEKEMAADAAAAVIDDEPVSTRKKSDETQ